jgi:hypothetical protein
MRRFALPLAIALVVAAPVLTAEASAPPADPGAQIEVEGQRPLGPPRNANQVVCRRQSVVGSRLRNQRVCASRQQWYDQRRTDRQLIEKAQTNRIWPGG